MSHVFHAGTYSAVVIANGGVNSTAAPMHGTNRGSFQVPAGMTGTTITVQVSNDNVDVAASVTNWTACPVEGNEANPITVGGGSALSTTHALPVKTMNFRWVRLVSGSAEGAARTINIWTQ